MLGDIVHAQGTLERLAGERAADGNSLGELDRGTDSGDATEFLALGDGAGIRQELHLFPIIDDLDVEQARRVERGEKVERTPGDRFVRIDLREVTIAAFGGGLHEAARPALADADAYVMSLCRQPLEEQVVAPVTERRDAGADVDEIRIAGRFEE